MTGVEAALKMRELGIRAPLIALTGNILRSERERCMNAGSMRPAFNFRSNCQLPIKLLAGFSAVLIKPVKRDVLLASIANSARFE